MQAASLFANGLQVALEQTVLHGLSPHEWQHVTLALYQQTGLYADRAAFAWEVPWFDRVLPSPGRALVVGGGGGAEAVQLAERGWTVHTTDGTGRLAEHAGRRLLSLGDEHHSSQATFAELASWRLDGGPAPEGWGDPDAGYDLALIGWGALSHIPVPSDRVRLLQSLSSLCPAGPILFSSICVGAPGTSRSRSALGMSLGQTAGLALGRLRGLTTPPTNGDRFFAHVGYGHEFSPDELEHLAQQAGLALIMDSGPDTYPHGRFMPQGA